MSLPPLRQLSSTPPTPSSERRPGGLHSLLNPEAEMMEQRGRRRSASQMESLSSIESQAPPSLPPLSRPTSVDSQSEIAPTRQFQPPARPGRHLLSPRSPNLHRTQSLGVLNPPTGTIDAHQSPFLTANSRPLGPDPISSQLGLPTPSVGIRTGYFSSVPPTAPTPPPGMIRPDIRRPSTNFPQSGSASPITSYSPYSQPASVASSQYDNSSQQGSYITIPTQGQEFSNPPIAMETERNLIPMAPSGQSSIQIMTIKSQQGHHVQIPVDVQAASKLADEKRKRNAGASARFRARRKEKEREASMSISRLEQQLRNAAEDVEYYRNERDHFKSIVFGQPGAERHYARPPSPRLRRSSAPSNATSSVAGGSNSSYDRYSESPEPVDRNVRRRTSSYHPVPGPPPSHVNGSGAQSQTYPAAPFSSMNPPPSTATPSHRGPPQVHPQHYDQRDQRSVQESQHPSSQAPGFRNPFASDPSRYDNRNWTPGPPGPGRDPRG
ncbi:hypothetical protein BDV96DRAFT_650923 [Lophiotrema nucula]|uniref:BZIP domain-containing protein n=1 Tax=Lophiotrema nucula TaxID=690887 RepID=A0A6A5YUR3_9PLEO|nr:hypothetical protein BDV96DRAFT_650923 [Lophiotrema nucula]